MIHYDNTDELIPFKKENISLGVDKIIHYSSRNIISSEFVQFLVMS